MASINKVILVGNLGQDPEVRSFQSGDKVANLSVATSESWKDRNSGERKEKTEWHRVAIFGPLADIAERFLRKGSKVYLEGKLVTRKWQDQSGNDRYSTEVVLQGYGASLVMLDGANNDNRQGGGGGRDSGGGFGGEDSRGRSSFGDGQGRQGGFGGGTGGGFPDDLDDDVPF